MKLLCLNNTNYESSLTVNKVYEIHTCSKFTIIQADNCVISNIPMDKFEVVKPIKRVKSRYTLNEYIKQGEKYDVLDINKDDGYEMYKIIQDNNMIMWVNSGSFELIEDKKEKFITLKFDSKELQEKLEKAIYHLKEFNSILDDLNSNGVNINIKRGDDK